MYFLSQYKKLFLASCISYQQDPEMGKTEIEEPTLMGSEAELKKHIESMKLKLNDLKNEVVGIDVTRIDSLQQKRDGLNTSQKYVGQQIETLEQLLLREEVFFAGEKYEVDDEMQQHYESINALRQRFTEYKREYQQYIEEIAAIDRTLETLKDNTLTETEQLRFQKISNKEFLAMSEQERLRFVTVGNMTAADVANGKHKHLDFTFTYDGVFNRDFYIRTTAGQVLPPEVREVTAGSEIFTRSGLNGEFFTESGKRLKIHEGTRVDISKLATAEELQKMQTELQSKVDMFAQDPFKDLAEEALKRDIDPKFTILMYGKEIEKTSGETRKVMIEDKLTDIARFQDDFSDDYPGKKSFEAGKVTEAFAGYLVNILNGNVDALVKEYGFDIKKLESYKKSEGHSAGPLNMEALNMEGVSEAEIQRILAMKQFIPGSREAQILFTLAAKTAGLPESWGTSSAMHRLLEKESAGKVGVLNYTIPKSYSTEEFRDIAMSRRNNNPIGVKSTASGLGQMLLSNVDIYYPDGRSGIGDALNEAVGMLRYIHDRPGYGSPERALAFHLSHNWY